VCVIVPNALTPSAIFPLRPDFFPVVTVEFERGFLVGFAVGVGGGADVAEGDN
jgi:hypothetical protein